MNAVVLVKKLDLGSAPQGSQQPLSPMAAIYWTELKWVAMLIVHNLKASAQFLLLEAIYRFCRWLSDWDDSFCIKIDNNNN